MSRSSGRLAALLLVVSFAVTSAFAADFETSTDPLVIETRNGPVSFTIEVAATREQHAQGLMNRTEMAADHGMLFNFNVSRDVTMWMKNTVLPLDMIFIGEDGVIKGIAENTEPYSETIIASPGPVRYVLEINAGVSADKGIAPGDRVNHPDIAKPE